MSIEAARKAYLDERLEAGLDRILKIVIANGGSDKAKELAELIYKAGFRDGGQVALHLCGGAVNEAFGAR